MLDDLLVLDLSRVLAGPYCTQLLADLGARVIKVESKRGDDTRGWGPPFEAGESAYFLSVNRGKQSVAVDLKDPRGRALVARLAARADVVVENFKVGDLARYGLDYATLARQHPALVYASITGFGQYGPRAGEAGYDAALQALSGVMAMTGEEGGPPVKLGVAWIDVLAGVHASTAVLAALWARARHGRGAHLDLALFDIALASLVNQAQSALLTGEPPGRLGSAHPSIVPYQAFQAMDGALVVAVGNDAQFQRLCRVCALPALADDARYATNAGRVEHRVSLLPVLAGRLRERTRGAWLTELRAAGVPATPVSHVTEALADPQADARGTVVRGEHPTAGTLPMVASALWHARGPDGTTLGLAPRPGDAAVPPRLGEHTRSVLRTDLGLTEEAIAELLRTGVVAEPGSGAPAS
jgi:crotonobetainyl-CoA:carnitine CoA-transferase CaiB-like acyl-CoA transferase